MCREYNKNRMIGNFKNNNNKRREYNRKRKRRLHTLDDETGALKIRTAYKKREMREQNIAYEKTTNNGMGTITKTIPNNNIKRRHHL